MSKRPSGQPEITSIDPKEYVQNISDVAARENLLNLVLSLRATLPNGIGVQDYTQFVRRSQELLQAIKRKPLVVSYSNGQRFGWLLGPKFSIDGTESVFKYAPLKHSFTVSIKAPAWLPAICLKAQSRWVSPEGKFGVPRPVQGFPSIDSTTHGDHSVSESATSGTYPEMDQCESGGLRIPMISDPTALTAVALNANDRSSRYPRIECPLNGNFVIRNPTRDNPQSLRIHGRDLWRNPKVFVGSSQATSVEILPDMNGLVATFNGPITISPDNSLADLTVITSFGTDTVSNGVQVLPLSSLEFDFNSQATRSLSSVEKQLGK